MQHDPSTPNAHTDPWKNQGSLGFSTWQRHVGLGLAEGGRHDLDTFGNQSDGGNDRGGFRAIYDRHASFAEGLISRWHPQNASAADPGRFIYAAPGSRLQRYSHPTASPEQSKPPATASLQHQPNHALHAKNQLIAAPIVANPVRSQVDSQAINRATESSGSPIPTPLSAANHVGNSGTDGLSFSGLVTGHARTGAGSATTISADIRASAERSMVLSRSSVSPSSDTPVDSLPDSSTGSSGTRIIGGTGLPISHQQSPTLSRSLTAPHIIRRLPHLDERIRRSYRQANAESMSGVEAEKSFYPGASRPIWSSAQNALPRYVERQGSGQHLQRSGDRALPLIPLVTETATISRSATYTGTAPVWRNDISDSFSPSASSSLSKSNEAISGRVPNTLATPNKIYRKQAAGSMAKIRFASQDFQSSMKEPLPMVTGTPSGASSPGSTGLSVAEASERFDGKTNESHEASISRGATSGSISHVLSRVTDTARRRGTAGSQDSIALTHSTPTHSSLALSFTLSANDRSGIALGSMQDNGANARSYSIKHIQRAQSDVVPTAQQSQRGKGREEYTGSGRYEAGGLPAVQRLMGKTSPIAAHRKIGAPQLSKLRVSPIHSPRPRETVTLSHPSERVLQKKPVSLLTERTRPLDQPVIRGAPHILRRSTALSGESVQHRSISYGINYSTPPLTEITDRGVSATAINTRPNLLSPRFLPLSRQADVAGSNSARLAVRSLTDTRVGIDPMHIGSMSAYSMGNGRINNTESVIARSSGIDVVDNAPSQSSDYATERAAASSSRSWSTPVALPEALGTRDHVHASLRLKPLALASSLHRVMRRAISRSAQPHGPSMSFGHDISTSGSLDHYSPALDEGRSIREAQSSRGSGSDGRPLVVLQRAHDKVVQAAVQREAVPVAPGSPEERYDVVSPQSYTGNTTLPRAGEGNQIAQSGAGQIDAEEIAEQVWRIMAERLVIEQERRGYAQWL